VIQGPGPITTLVQQIPPPKVHTANGWQKPLLPAPRQHRPLLRPITARRIDPAPTASTAPNPQNSCQTDVPAPVGPCSKPPALYSARCAAAPPLKETALTGSSLRVH